MEKNRGMAGGATRTASGTFCEPLDFKLINRIKNRTDMSEDEKIEALAELGAYDEDGNEIKPIPTLSDMGLDKKTSKLAQDIGSWDRGLERKSI